MLGLTTGGLAMRVCGLCLLPVYTKPGWLLTRPGALLSILRPGLPLRGALSAPLGIEFPPRKLWA